MLSPRPPVQGPKPFRGRTIRTLPGRTTLPLLLLSAGLLAGCGGDASVDPVEVRNLTLVVEPTKLFLGEGENGALHARLEDEAGNPVPTTDLQWSSSDASVATVSDDGIVSAIKNGTVTITASSTGKKKDAKVGVRGKGRLEIFLASGTGQAGPVDEMLPLPLVVEVRDKTGAAVPGVDVDWRSGDDDGHLTASTTTTGGRRSSGRWAPWRVPRASRPR